MSHFSPCLHLHLCFSSNPHSTLTLTLGSLTFVLITPFNCLYSWSVDIWGACWLWEDCLQFLQTVKDLVHLSQASHPIQSPHPNHPLVGLYILGHYSPALITAGPGASYLESAPTSQSRRKWFTSDNDKLGLLTCSFPWKPQERFLSMFSHPHLPLNQPWCFPQGAPWSMGFVCTANFSLAITSWAVSPTVHE